MENRKALYVFLFTLLFGSVQIKHTEAETSPFLSTPTISLFVAAITCHGLASMADTNIQGPAIIFHLSGIVGCEILIWVLLPDILLYCIVNVIASLVAWLCFFNPIPNIFASPSTVDHEMPIIEMQSAEGQV